MIHVAFVAVPLDNTTADGSQPQSFPFTKRSEQNEGLRENKEALHE